MKKVIDKAESRGRSLYDWLDSHHTFSFDEYYNPRRMNFGALRVLNDDRIAPGKGFGTHPHKNMEIISIPLKGKLKHGDSKQNSRTITTGDIQTMSRCGRRGAGAADGRRHAGPCRADAGRDAGGTGQRRHGRIHAAGAGIPAKNDGTGPRATKITALNPYILWNRTIFTRRYSK